MRKVKEQKAITLIALVITIVVLVILASVAINLSLGNNGIFSKAKYAKSEYLNAKNEEETKLAQVEDYIDSYRENSSKIVCDILWEGTGSTLNTTYNFKEATMDITNYKFILIELEERLSDEPAKNSILLDSNFISKNTKSDIMYQGFSDRCTALHFVDNGFVIDSTAGGTRCFYIKKIIGFDF